MFKQVVPASDGYLHLDFVPIKDGAFLNAIEITPGQTDRLRPIRLVMRDLSYTDAQGELWLPDTYVSGGRLMSRQQEVTGSPDAGLFRSERYGNFTYSVPVPPGKYTLVLYFAETWYGPGRPDGGGAGSRLFDVLVNGQMLLRNFDIFQEAGGGYRAVVKRFSGIQATAQGKLNLAFLPDKNYACVNAIEILDETPSLRR